MISIGYLGDSVEEQEEWNLYDASVIVSTVPPGRFDDILIDCGTADTFLKAGQLLPEVRPTHRPWTGSVTHSIAQRLNVTLHALYYITMQYIHLQR